jgi:hypothetical protein
MSFKRLHALERAGGGKICRHPWPPRQRRRHILQAWLGSSQFHVLACVARKWGRSGVLLALQGQRQLVGKAWVLQGRGLWRCTV